MFVTPGKLCGNSAACRKALCRLICASMDSESKLEQFILLSKGARGPALAKLIENVTGEAGIFSFGALLDVPSIREARSCSASASQQSAQYSAFELRLLVAVSSVCY